MSRWAVVAAAALAAGGVIPAFAGAATAPKKQKCSFTLTALAARVEVISGNPPINGTSLSAAAIDGKLCGKSFHGAARLVRTNVGSQISGTFTYFGPLGSFRGTFSGTGPLNPTGTSSFTGKGKVTGGTGLYSGATGSFTASGAKPSGTSPSALTFKGTLKY